MCCDICCDVLVSLVWSSRKLYFLYMFLCVVLSRYEEALVVLRVFLTPI